MSSARVPARAEIHSAARPWGGAADHRSMRSLIMTRTFFLAGAALAVGLTGTAFAGANDYAFEPVATEVNRGEVTISVRLVHKPTGKSVPDVVIVQTRIDMAPDGMA